MVVVAIAGAALSAGWMTALFSPDGDVSRIYYGTDTRLFELLIGAVLALVWLPAVAGSLPNFAQLTDTRPLARRIGPRDGIAAAGLLALAWAFVALSEYDEALYRGGLVIVAIVTAVVIAMVIHPTSWIGPKVLDSRPVRWIGQRSYGIYLWHWPVFVVTRPGLDVGLDPIATLVLRIGMTVGLAAASYLRDCGRSDRDQ